ncbi:hypothetical protein KSP40_PGU007271 [Platanthera guangdongensis]|uniref:Uncharacterized protein n=1 Tax=Platanthera guangdongensis TaxID=2320717 RepID=A0ABR2M898_9ASPA
MSKEKAKLAAEKASERLRGQKPSTMSLKPLPLEKKNRPSLNVEIKKMPASSKNPQTSSSTRPVLNVYRPRINAGQTKNS